MWSGQKSEERILRSAKRRIRQITAGRPGPPPILWPVQHFFKRIGTFSSHGGAIKHGPIASFCTVTRMKVFFRGKVLANDCHFALDLGANVTVAAVPPAPVRRRCGPRAA